MNSKDVPLRVLEIPTCSPPDWGECPCCGKNLFCYGKFVEMNYCHYCGQKLMWWNKEQEVWDSMHGKQITVPEGTFEKIFYGED